MIVTGDGLKKTNGSQTTQTTPVQTGLSKKKKSTAILLCLIVFGAFGLHRFYVGKTKSGGLLLLVSFLSCGTFGVIWGLYDLFTLMFSDNFTDAAGLPLR